MAIGFRTSGMFGRPSMQQPIPMQAPQPAAMPIGVEQMQKKPGFFQKGGFGQYALAAISDFAARRGGHNQNMLGDVMAFKMQEEDAKIRQQMADQKRMQDREDMQWEWQNKPKDVNPYRWKANDGSLMELGPDGQPRQVYKDPNKRLEYRQGPDGRFYPIDTADAPLHPVTDDEWNSASPMGGSGGNVTGGFR